MSLSVTEFQKGKKLLSKALGISGDINFRGYKRAITNRILKEILSTGKCDLLDGLDKAGKHFRKSWKTRYTSLNHKINDFSSVQAKSSMNLQIFYNDMAKVQNKKSTHTASTSFQDINDVEDEDLRKQLNILNEKIQKEIKSLNSLINLIPSMKDDGSKNTLKTIQENGVLNKEYNAELKSLINSFDKDIEFTDEDKKVLPQKSVSALLGAIVGTVGVMGISSIATVTLGLTVGTGGAGIIVVGCELAVLVALGIGMLVCMRSKRLKDIAAKRQQAKIYDHMRKIIKYTNQANNFVQKYNGEQNDDDEIVINGNQRQTVNTFINKQKLLWEKYATAEGREYTKSEDDKHTSGIIKRSNDRNNDKLQCAKRAIANTWTKLYLKDGT